MRLEIDENLEFISIHCDIGRNKFLEFNFKEDIDIEIQLTDEEIDKLIEKLKYLKEL